MSTLDSSGDPRAKRRASAAMLKALGEIALPNDMPNRPVILPQFFLQLLEKRGVTVTKNEGYQDLFKCPNFREELAYHHALGCMKPSVEYDPVEVGNYKVSQKRLGHLLLFVFTVKDEKIDTLSVRRMAGDGSRFFFDTQSIDGGFQVTVPVYGGCSDGLHALIRQSYPFGSIKHCFSDIEKQFFKDIDRVHISEKSADGRLLYKGLPSDAGSPTDSRRARVGLVATPGDVFSGFAGYYSKPTGSEDCKAQSLVVNLMEEYMEFFWRYNSPFAGDALQKEDVFQLLQTHSLVPVGMEAEAKHFLADVQPEIFKMAKFPGEASFKLSIDCLQFWAFANELESIADSEVSKVSSEQLREAASSLLSSFVCARRNWPVEQGKALLTTRSSVGHKQSFGEGVRQLLLGESSKTLSYLDQCCISIGELLPPLEVTSDDLLDAWIAANFARYLTTAVLQWSQEKAFELPSTIESVTFFPYCDLLVKSMSPPKDPFAMYELRNWTVKLINSCDDFCVTEDFRTIFVYVLVKWFQINARSNGVSQEDQDQLLDSMPGIVKAEPFMIKTYPRRQNRVSALLKMPCSPVLQVGIVAAGSTHFHVHGADEKVEECPHCQNVIAKLKQYLNVPMEGDMLELCFLFLGHYFKKGRYGKPCFVSSGVEFPDLDDDDGNVVGSAEQMVGGPSAFDQALACIDDIDISVFGV